MKRFIGILFGILVSTLAIAQGTGNGGGNPRSFRVVDRSNKLVGQLLGDGIVAREIDGFWVQFCVNPVTGITDSEAVYVYFASSDCTGAEYLPRYRVFLEGVRVGSRLYYPTDTVEMSPQSLRVASENAAFDTTCREIAVGNRFSYVFGTAASIKVNSLGLELPFRAVQ